MLQVNLEDHTGNKTRQTKMAENAPVAKLIPALVSALGLPATDPAGRAVTYHLSFNGQQLEDEATLQTAGVRNGDRLALVPEMSAGGLAARLARVARHRLSALPLPPTPPLPPLVEVGEEIGPPHVQPGLPDFAADWRGQPGVGVCVRAAALQKIQAHATAHPMVEVGGLLTGQVYAEDERFVVLIEDAQAAQQTLATCASLQFTYNSWLQILAERAAQPQLTTLGWYHSHPGLGIFLSETDRFTHKHFFGAEPWYVALVVDPLADAQGAFVWQADELLRAEVRLV